VIWRRETQAAVRLSAGLRPATETDGLCFLEIGKLTMHARFRPGFEMAVSRQK
jgi:hypothetical protein